MRLATLVAAGTAAAALAVTGCGSKSSGSGSGGGGASGGQFGVDFCTAAQTVKVSVSSLALSTSNPTDLAGSKSAVQIATASIDNLDDAASSDISSDTHTVRTTLDSANTKVQAAADVGAVQSALNGVAGGDYAKAYSRVDAYVTSHCGFSLGTSSGTPGGAAGPGSTSTSSTSSHSS